jgi:hypothetical protein
MARKPKPDLKIVDDDRPQDDPNAPQIGEEGGDDPEAKERAKAARDRDEELSGDKDIAEKFIELMKDVSRGFQAQWERGNDQLDYWDLYDLVLGGRQAYAGNSQIYLPLVRQAINARKTRFVNQIFPRSGRNVDCITSDDKPYDIMALLEHYIRKAKLRTQVMPALMKNGDIEGQYNLYVSWSNSKRHVVIRKKSEIDLGDDMKVEDPSDDDEEDIEEVETEHMEPTVEVLADADVLILPHTANSVGDALAKGGSATIIRRWSKARIKKAIEDEEIDAEIGEDLIEEMGDSKENPGAPEPNKKHVDAAGITTTGGSKELVLYETWTNIKVDDELRLVRGYYAGTKGDEGSTERVMSIKRGPYWNDKCPLLSAPIDKISGVFKGQSQCKQVSDLQYAANDTINEAMDSAAYALMPIVMTDPSKNPRVGSMVLNLAAIWETNPNDTKFAQFPSLWKDGLTIVSGLKTEVFQILSVSPAMMPQSSGQKSGKRNQAEIALEQQVDVLSTADVCTNLEDEILTPLLRWFVELDYQFRRKDITVKQYGQMGIRAAMQEVKPIQSDRRYEFRWFGVEAARNAQMMQTQTAALNVVKGMPPQTYAGYELNLVPVISMWLENAFGPRVTPEIFKSIKEKFTVAPDMENEWMMEGLDLPIHELDDDKEHMQEHIKAMKGGDPQGVVRRHMMLHRMQMSKKMQMAAQGLAAQQQGGGEGGGGPRPGAQTQGPRGGGQQPAGAIHSDRMQDPSAAPRR